MTGRGRAQPVEHGLQLDESMGCSKVQRCERADHFQSTMPSYSHPVSFIHQQKDGLEFGRERYRFALTRVEMFQSRIDSAFTAGGIKTFDIGLEEYRPLG